MNQSRSTIEAAFWDAADELRANSKLKASEYSVPVLGMIFLRYADQKFQAAAEELGGAGTGRRKIGPADYHARGVLYLPEYARFSTLLQLPEGANMAATAVISADRRYVRVTVIPIFSAIGKVLKFNIQTGEIGDGDPDFDEDDGGDADGFPAP